MTTLRGPQAELRWGYHPAATLGPWTLQVDSTGGTVTASIVTVDTFRVSQQPVTFQVTRPGATWRWPVVSLQIAAQTVTAVLGPPE